MRKLLENENNEQRDLSLTTKTETEAICCTRSGMHVDFGTQTGHVSCVDELLTARQPVVRQSRSDGNNGCGEYCVHERRPAYRLPIATATGATAASHQLRLSATLNAFLLHGRRISWKLLEDFKSHFMASRNLQAIFESRD